MKKRLFFLLTGLVVFFSCSTQNKSVDSQENEESHKTGNSTLVVYFSCTGTTERFAKYGAEYLKADTFKIEAAVPYTAEDIAYYTNCRADKEQNDPSARPAIANTVDITKYERIVLGYPIWHGQAPRIISTFLESYDFSGKTIIPFCTSASSGIGNSDANLHSLCSAGTIWKNGKRFSSSTTKEEFCEFLGTNL